MTTTWVLVAHDAGARLFENRGPGKGLVLLERIEHADGRQSDQEFDADRPGRSFRRNAGDARRSAMSRSEGPRDRAVADHARRLASKLEDGRVADLFERLVLVAPPKFLGRLRGALDEPTARCVVGSLDKDLAASDEAELVKQVGQVLAV
ncbi:MAG: host attachment protein [Myxococcota bacterium]